MHLREEAKRKTIHICGVAIPVLYHFLKWDLVVLGFVFSFFIIFVIEWLRLTVSFIIGCLVLHSLPVAVFGAIGAVIADGVPLRAHRVIIDDNLTIPLFSGALMSFGSIWYLF